MVVWERKAVVKQQVPVAAVTVAIESLLAGLQSLSLVVNITEIGFVVKLRAIVPVKILITFFGAAALLRLVLAVLLGRLLFYQNLLHGPHLFLFGEFVEIFVFVERLPRDLPVFLFSFFVYWVAIFVNLFRFHLLEIRSSLIC